MRFEPILLFLLVIAVVFCIEALVRAIMQSDEQHYFWMPVVQVRPLRPPSLFVPLVVIVVILVLLIGVEVTIW